MEVRSFNLGRMTVHLVPDGYMYFDGGCTFGMVPKALWSKKVQPDGLNRVRHALNVYLVQVDGMNVLLDAGVGTGQGQKVREIYGLEQPPNTLEGLAALGISPEDVHIIIASHLHFDHVAGAVCRNAMGLSKPVFPRARHYAHRREWEAATGGHPRLSIMYRRESFAPLMEAGALELVDGETEVIPGVRVVPTGGHTAGHQIVLLESEGERAIYWGDLIPSLLHLATNWVTAWDSYPLDTAEVKERLAHRAAEDRSLCLFSHEAESPIAYLRRTEEGIVAEAGSFAAAQDDSLGPS